MLRDDRSPGNRVCPGCRGGDIELILWSIHFSLHYLGFHVLPPFAAFGIQGHGYVYAEEDSNNRRLLLYRETWKERLKNLDRDTPLAFQGWDNWESGDLAKAART